MTQEAEPVPLDPTYLRKIRKGLDKAFEAAEEIEFDPRRERLVIVSDQHKGTRDGADDFLRCEPAYGAALGHYLEGGYRLYVLGDVEELWENRPGPVLDSYPDVLELEAAFHRDGRYERFWGNHDDLWRSTRAVRKQLAPVVGELNVREALKLRVQRPDAEPGLIFLAHGHQGTADSDRFGWLSRFVVRVIWRRIQARFGFTATTPAKDFNLRAKHDRAMFEWAQAHPERPVLIAGHTHRPVFWTDTPPPPPVRDLDVIRVELRRRRHEGADPATIAALRAELEFALAEQREHKTAIKLSPPCYFNTGCCSFGDGDITGIEIADGEMRLVKWPATAPTAMVLAREPLSKILDAVAHPETAPAIEAVEVTV